MSMKASFPCGRVPVIPATRREFLQQTALGFGSLAFAALVTQSTAGTPIDSRALSTGSPLAPKLPHFQPRAKRVILLFMEGGPSHVDLLDYKPELFRRHGQRLSAESLPRHFREGKAENPEDFGPLMATPVKFKQYGQSGLWLSDVIPHIAQCADQLCVLKGMVCDSTEHGTAVQQFHTGMVVPRPSMGAWITYALGTENQNLPGFVVISPPAGTTINCGSGFLPPIYQATLLHNTDKSSGEKLRYLTDPRLPPELRRKQLELLREINREHAQRAGQDTTLESMIESFEMAARMQLSAPEVLDISRETPETMARYGIGAGETDSFGRQCLLARRLVEAGVRFIQVTSKGWDHHNMIHRSLRSSCARVDKPTAALLTDLKQRGLLDDTLVIWSGEFGRTPLVQGVRGKTTLNYEALGRGHNPYGWSLWLAGGGVKGGFCYGKTDDFGFQAVEDRVHIHDLHATILYLLGLDHERLTYRHAGRDFRLTDVHGRVVKEIVA
ncbi:MAG: sulfatase [Gemmataceae bacterium]|uniref:DUF1501 domain-containing protein n=2 Tax=Thermogemmata fonticola TaxID=2755323 RepID=A0A7V9AD16_9BACT|nr:DUF1501 domain-containing protein [Thermogemmata fonticola]GIW85313.1 MAG: sulfatase [Gemmataceae bacterium]